MMKFVLIALLLQLCLFVLDVHAGKGAAGKETDKLPGVEVDEKQLKFGDLLVFSNKKLSHYAVYVNGEQFDEKKDDENIFEMTNDPEGCRFYKVEGPFRRHNYLDEDIEPKLKRVEPQTREKMISTIKELMKKDVCKTYSVTSGNCEQIATKVRYGTTSCKQVGTNSAKLAKFLPNPKIKRHEASAAA